MGSFQPAEDARHGKETRRNEEDQRDDSPAPQPWYVARIAESSKIGRSTVSQYLAGIESAKLSWPEADPFSGGELQSRSHED